MAEQLPGLLAHKCLHQVTSTGSKALLSSGSVTAFTENDLEHLQNIIITLVHIGLLDGHWKSCFGKAVLENHWNKGKAGKKQ